MNYYNLIKDTRYEPMYFYINLIKYNYSNDTIMLTDHLRFEELF